MLYYHPTHYCCYSPTSSTVHAQNKQKNAGCHGDGEDPNRHQPTKNNHSPLALYCYIADICCLLRCGALRTRQECSSVCGSLLLFLSWTQDVSTHQLDNRDRQCTVYSSPPADISPISL